MGALFDYPSFVDDDDLIGVSDGREAVGDDEAGAPFHQLVESLLDLHLGAGVDRAGGLVKDEDSRIGQDRPGDGNELTLPLGEISAAFGENSVIPLREATDEGVGVSQPRCFDNLCVAGVKTAVADVLHDRFAEQERLLENDPKLTAQAVARDTSNINAVNADRPILRFVETRKQVDQGGLAGTGVTNQGHAFAGPGMQTDVI